MGGWLSYVPEGTYCVLKQVGQGNESWDSVWMSDTPLEHTTNYDALQEATGDVLVVGLGLGMLSLAMCRKKEVRSVTVLELEPDVVRLISTHVKHRKLQIIVADGTQPPLRGRRFDLIYVDIWPNICSDNWTEMKPMLAEYRRHRRNGGVVDGWMKDYVQKEHNKPKGGYW
jgi:spermidine synthase